VKAALVAGETQGMEDKEAGGAGEAGEAVSA